MSDWELPFCLACDRQTEGDVYCSESCRVSEWERACSSAGSTASSPQSPRASTSWPVSKPSNHPLYLAPKYNFNKPQPYGTTPSPRTSTFNFTRPQSSPPAYASRPVLTPSSSMSSFEGLMWKDKSTEQAQVSDEDRRALRDYERCFDQSRYARRQSTQ